MFTMAQWATNSEAAKALARMSARQAKGDPGLAKLVRERQDLVLEWRTRDELRNTNVSQPAEKRNRETEGENLTRLDIIDKRVAAIDKALSAQFPDYAALTNPEPLSVLEVQAQLGANEALVLFLDASKREPTPEETFIWIVTKTDMRWLRSDIGTQALAQEVSALRCGLDKAGWTKGASCKQLTGRNAPNDELHFDIARSHRLYETLLGPAKDLIKGKDLSIVPSGALTQLPFQVLVTEPLAATDYRSVPWLIRDHALTVLPAVSSLTALRRVSRPSKASKPLIGFGNPLLDGPDASYLEYARLAQGKRSCRDDNWERIATNFGLLNGVAPIDMRRGLANISQLRKQMPLPETAEELCAVAADIKADVSEVRLGARATESEVKKLSESGALADYRVVHFATHGAMAGELSGDSEPGLILTPPDQATEQDDGYLTASEIAALQLDADWVVLSACNTAAGDAANAEALSGLARAFIYAQARALLVSHWAVDSHATVKLITTAMREITRDKPVGRAEALRRAMLVSRLRITDQFAASAFGNSET
ncbi:MAG: CHAT domain-containing protein [Rhodomicrobium sp.]|nr:CHAT domain-containing protein [Rhodomicrobium sp.]